MATKYENSTSGTGGMTITGGYFGQTFTPLITHKLTSVKISMGYAGSSPGTVTVSIRSTSNGLPTGNDIVLGTMNGATLTSSPTWYEITMNSPIIVYAGTQYAIVITATDVTKLGVQVYINISTDAYSRGACALNTTGTWSLQPDYTDLNFEEWGNPDVGGLFFCLG